MVVFNRAFDSPCNVRFAVGVRFAAVSAADAQNRGNRGAAAAGTT